MTTTTFIDNSTPIVAEWLNEVDALVHDVFNGATTDAEARTNLGLTASSGSSLVGFLQSGIGANATTVQAKLREIVSVKDFGAVGDGVTNDSAAINSAIDYAAASGGKLYIPSGTYMIDAALRIEAGENNIHIEGAGFSTVLKKFADSSNSILRIYGSHCTVSNLQMDGVDAYTTDTSLLFLYGDYITVDNCYIHHSGKNGIAFADDGTQQSFCTISNCIITDNDGVGVSCAKGHGIVITGCHIHNNGLEGITLDQGTEYSVVQGNTISTNMQVGGIGEIGYDNMLHCVINGNIFLGDGTGEAIRMGNAMGDSIACSFVGNTFEDYICGIDLTGTASTTAGDQNLAIVGNSFRNCTCGIDYESDTPASWNCTKLQIGNNTFASCTTAVNSGDTNDAILESSDCYWSVRLNTAANNVTGNGTLARVPYGVTVLNNSVIPVTHDTTTNIGQVTIPITGIYNLNASVEITSAGSGTSGVIEIQSDGVAISRRKYSFNGTPTEVSMEINCKELLVKGAVLSVHASLTGVGADTADFSARPLGTEFFGSLI